MFPRKLFQRYPASSGFSRPDATVASGLEKPLLAGYSSDNLKLIVGWFLFFLSSFLLFSFDVWWRLAEPHQKATASLKRKAVLNLMEIRNDCCLLRMGPFLLRLSRKNISRSLYFHWNTRCITLQWFYGALQISYFRSLVTFLSIARMGTTRDRWLRL